MATLNQVNANDYDFATNATSYAQQARDTYEQQLNNELMQYLDKAYQSQQEAQEIRKQSALDAITRQVRDTQEQYQTDVQNNYAQKMIAQNQAASDIAEAGVAGTGFDSSNMIGVRNQYATNYNELTKQRNKDIRAIGEKEIDTINEYNAQAKELESEYNRNVLSQKQYINEQAENKYYQEYQNQYNAQRQAKIDYDNAQQQAYENYWAEKKYEDDMAYREWQKQMQEKQYQLEYMTAQAQASYYRSLSSGSVGGSGGSGSSGSGGSGSSGTSSSNSGGTTPAWQAIIPANISKHSVSINYGSLVGNVTANDKKILNQLATQISKNSVSASHVTSQLNQTSLSNTDKSTIVFQLKK